MCINVNTYSKYKYSRMNTRPNGPICHLWSDVLNTKKRNYLVNSTRIVPELRIDFCYNVIHVVMTLRNRAGF